jgi:nicotinamide-nucleotide amidase
MITFPREMIARAEEVLNLCRRQGLRLATAESCTGGLLATLLTEIPGSSRVFDRGFVTYSNEAKLELLDVSADLINWHGAVSDEVAIAMAQGALRRSRADLAVSVTGVAGPSGGTAEKPVGLVFLACMRGEEKPIRSRLDLGERRRNEIREAAVREALRLLRENAVQA